MREIKFRGMDIDGRWYYGNLSVLTKNAGLLKAGHYISNKVGMPFAYQVRPETIGQFTGLQDKNGKEIYEGDIVNLDGYDSHGDFGEYKVEFSGTFKVIWHNEIASFDLQRINATVDGWMLSHDSKDDLEVIGNIHESPHLLVGGESHG